MTDLELIAYAEQHAQQDALLPREHIIQLLSIEPGSDAWRELGAAARRVSHKLTGDLSLIHI